MALNALIIGAAVLAASPTHAGGKETMDKAFGEVRNLLVVDDCKDRGLKQLRRSLEAGVELPDMTGMSEQQKRETLQKFCDRMNAEAAKPEVEKSKTGSLGELFESIEKDSSSGAKGSLGELFGTPKP